jgi:MoaA/NifB/PqqE/SkfB family radical SAM enzyme
LLTQEHVKKLRDFHVNTNRRGRKPKICAFNHVESPEYFGCGGGTQHMFIDYNGQVCPCDFTPLSFGCIEQQPLAEIWQRMNDAMNNPRRNCFIRKNYHIIQKHYGATGVLPLPPEMSEKVCNEAGTEDFSDYFAMVTGRKR